MAALQREFAGKGLRFSRGEQGGLPWLCLYHVSHKILLKGAGIPTVPSECLETLGRAEGDFSPGELPQGSHICIHDVCIHADSKPSCRLPSLGICQTDRFLSCDIIPALISAGGAHCCPIDLFWLKHQPQSSQQSPRHMHSSLGIGQETNACLGSGVFLGQLASRETSFFLEGDLTSREIAAPCHGLL